MILNAPLTEFVGKKGDDSTLGFLKLATTEVSSKMILMVHGSEGLKDLFSFSVTGIGHLEELHGQWWSNKYLIDCFSQSPPN